MNPHEVTQDFESALCKYTGAPFAVVVDSCTNALLLSVEWSRKWRGPGTEVVREVEIPKFTYNGVADSIIHAGAKPVFRDESWSVMYQLKPLPVWDCARWFTGGMYAHAVQFQEVEPRLIRGGYMCVSFHISKILGASQGGAILHDDPEADAWFRRARFDGRTEGVAPKDDKFIVGHHCYISPDVAAQLLWKLSFLPYYNHPLPNSEYADLSLQECYK